MRILITGHRLFKLEQYNIIWIKGAILQTVIDLKDNGLLSYGYSGMASGVDLWFCKELFNFRIPYAACIPFERQEETMNKQSQDERKILISNASVIHNVKNSYMVEKCDMGIVVWDGNKGGTHNVLQQLVEKKKPFIWINPVSEKIWNCA